MGRRRAVSGGRAGRGRGAQQARHRRAGRAVRARQAGARHAGLGRWARGLGERVGQGCALGALGLFLARFDSVLFLSQFFDIVRELGL